MTCFPFLKIEKTISGFRKYRPQKVFVNVPLKSYVKLVILPGLSAF